MSEPQWFFCNTWPLLQKKKNKRASVMQQAHGDQTSRSRQNVYKTYPGIVLPSVCTLPFLVGNFWTSVTPLQKRCRVPQIPLKIWEFLSNSDLNPGVNRRPWQWVVVWDLWDAANQLGKRVWMVETDDLFIYQPRLSREGRRWVSALQEN